MVHKHEVQGRIYRFKQKSICLELGVTVSEISTIPSRVRSHLVLVLDTVKGRKGYVKIMAITSHTSPPGTYLPISPTPKKHYPLQVRLLNNQANQSELVITRLPGRGNRYLRVDERWEVPVLVLEGVEDGLGDEIMVAMKKRGGMGELRNWLEGCDRRRERARAVEKKEREEDVKKQDVESEKEDGAEMLEIVGGNEVKEENTEQVDILTLLPLGIRWVLGNLSRVLNPM